jgi:hypothetical protein
MVFMVSLLMCRDWRGAGFWEQARRCMLTGRGALKRFTGWKQSARARGNSLQELPTRPEREAMRIMLVLGAAVALALGLCSACAPIGTYVASHWTNYVFPRGGGGGGNGG